MLIFVPLGASFIVTTSAPKDLKSDGEVIYEAPFAQSSTTFLPSKRQSDRDIANST